MHHYTEYMEQAILDEASENAQYLMSEYTKLENSDGMPPITTTQRLQPLF